MHPVKAFHPGQQKRSSLYCSSWNNPPGLESAHQFDAGFEVFCTGRHWPGKLGRRVWPRAGLHLAQEPGITADAVVVDFIGNDSTLGLTMKLPRGPPLHPRVNSEILHSLPVGSPSMGYWIRLIVSDASCRLCAQVAVRGNGMNLVPAFWNSSYKSANRWLRGQTKN